MPTKVVKVTGGEKYKALLAKIAAQKVGVKVGILQGSTTTEGQSIVQYAAAHEFGMTIPIPEHTQLMPFREDKKTGKLKMVKRKKATILLEGHVKKSSFTMPTRPFLRQTVEHRQEEWCKELAQMLKGEITKGTAKPAMHKIGEAMKADVKREIESGNFKALKPATIKAKLKRGKTSNPEHPLIDTGQMMEAVDYEVVEG
ncbi:hypothetical protein [Cloacibacillus sp. An23]|uniref:hypothetical protein n=1 Tax=Cloacibacillus sp. An23 TaxID=1965591 RepID=UPI000B39B571|nr:hypothetical protein [Cloacibacillus sp. An23]OUO94801.1 hypothetical protein B5F39_02730 [Cloacibacillus sp. An23]